MNTDHLREELKKISKMLDMGKELINEDLILVFQSDTNNLLKNMDEVMQEKRKMCLGVVGEVKAGKTSFLNALLFEGKDILPKAPTPMTATLTHISYSVTPAAKIVFYSSDDWNAVCALAGEYDKKLQSMYQEYVNSTKSRQNRFRSNFASVRSIDEFEKIHRDEIPAEYRSCKELLSMAMKRNLDAVQYLDTEKCIKGDASNKYDYFQELNDYIGSDGFFTPIVKYTEIQLCNKMLEGIDIIDTPGLNDPVSSRSRITQDFLIKCDAVFLLSYCGQFLNAEDMRFIMSSLPNDGITKAVLIGSKLDSAILQYPDDNNPSFHTAYVETVKNCMKLAEQNIKECRKNDYNGKLLDQLKDSLPPYCISSLAYSAAVHLEKGEPLDKEEKHIFNNFRQSFSDFTFNADILKRMSSIPDIKGGLFEEIKQQKDQILQDKIADTIRNRTGNFISMLEDIANQVRMNQRDLKKYDYGQLKEKLTASKESLDSVRIVVKSLFDRAAIESVRTIEEISIEIEKEMKNHLEILINTDRKLVPHDVETGFFRKIRHHWEEEIKTDKAEINDAVENIREYMINCMQIVNMQFQHLLKIGELKNNIKDVVIKAFEQSDKDFDEDRILIPLENSLSRITIPKLELDAEIYYSMLDNYLTGIVTNGVVKGEKISLLKQAQYRVLSKMSDDIVLKIREQGRGIDNLMLKLSGIFIDDIVGQISTNQQKIERMLKDKQLNLDRMERFLHKLTSAKILLQNLEI